MKTLWHNSQVSIASDFFLLTASFGSSYQEKKDKSVRNMVVIYCVQYPFPASFYLFKVINRNTKKKCEICSKLIIKTPERHQWRLSGVFIVNFEHISLF